ncbi:MAG TPA: LLM class F420-dependent oxidoreductase [Chloroflexia bacterium]|nr:LLM class F420-dependent oxidoreductase [Chloroflexia bacterium]
MSNNRQPVRERTMRIGVVFPQTEIGTDPMVIRDYAQAAEDLGYSHLLVYDHVLGASTANRPDWRGPYTSDTQFHEPFVLFGYLAGMTERIELVTGVIILPQRQTALVAKQAAEVDILSGGRLRLGVGVGWNPIEYEGLGQDFGTRGKRIEEQVHMLRALWTEPVVEFEGQTEQLRQAGINPLPVQRPIPIWMGGEADVVLKRIGRMADGWFPQMRPDEEARRKIKQIRDYVQEAGRDPDSLGIEARLNLSEGNSDTWRQEMDAWQDLGATHLGINTMRMRLGSPQEHIRMLESARASIS